jgi:hypothetical protein
MTASFPEGVAAADRGGFAKPDIGAKIIRKRLLAFAAG